MRYVAAADYDMVVTPLDVMHTYFVRLLAATAKHPWPEFSNNLAALFHVATSKHPPPVPERLSPECANFTTR